MANWSGAKVDASDINGGNEYERKDRVSREQLNAIVNNSLYAQAVSEEALEKADSAFTGNGTIARVGGVPKAFLDFESDPQEQLDKTEKTEVIYDMDGGSSLDWGRSGGIVNEVEITGKDFSKYKGLYAYIAFYGETQRFYLDLTRLTANNEYCAGHTNISRNIDTYESSLIVVNSAKTSIKLIFRYGIDSWTAGYPGDIYMYRLEGVL